MNIFKFNKAFLDKFAAYYLGYLNKTCTAGTGHPYGHTVGPVLRSQSNGHMGWKTWNITYIGPGPSGTHHVKISNYYPNHPVR